MLQSITPYYKVVLEYYFEYSRTILYYKVLRQYYKVLLQYHCLYYKVPLVLLPYYKVLLQYYKVLLHYCTQAQDLFT